MAGAAQQQMRTFILTSAVLACSLFASSADAATLTLTPATPGLTFTIDNLGLAAADLYTADGTNDTYQLLLTLTTTTAYVDAGAGADLLAAFSLNVSTSAVQGATLVSSPAGYSWTLFADNKVPGNSAKCNGNDPGSLCVEETASASGNLVLDANGVYSWLFNVDLGSTGFGEATGLDVGIGTLKKTGPNYAFQGSRSLTGLAGSSALPPAGGNPGTDPGTDPGTNPGGDPVTAPVPEPGSLVLLGSGLLIAASQMRRRRS